MSSRPSRPVSILEHFSTLTDPRQQWRVIYPLREILLLVLCATLCGMEDFVETELWDEERLDFLRCFLPYERGIPAHDTLNDVIDALDPELFKACFSSWVQALRDGAPDIVAVVLRQARDEGQDIASFACPQPRPCAFAPGLGLGRTAAPGPRPRGHRPEIERDHGHPAFAGAARARRRARHHRRNGSPDRNRRNDRPARRRLSSLLESQ